VLRKNLIASNPHCAKDINSKRCPKQYKDYKDCTDMIKPPTFRGEITPGKDETDIDKECWNG
jgi:hypothetical protein